MPSLSRTNRERSPWALVSFFIILVCFGFFWWWQQQLISVQTTPEPDSAVPQQPLEESSTVPIDISLLEASAVNIPIPEFSILF